jgi:hypothetical protein
MGKIYENSSCVNRTLGYSHGMNANTTAATVKWSLVACCRIHKVTIREIAKHMGITLKRVREVRDSREVLEFTAWEFVTSIRQIAKAKGGVA